MLKKQTGNFVAKVKSKINFKNIQRYVITSLTGVVYPLFPEEERSFSIETRLELKKLMLFRFIALCAIFVLGAKLIQFNIRTYVPRYLTENGEAVIQSIKNLENKNKLAALQGIFMHNLQNGDLGFLGSKDSSNVIVAYIDYSCPFSRKALKELETMINHDRVDVKIILNDINVSGKKDYIFEVTHLFAHKYPDLFQKLVWLISNQNFTTLTEDEFVNLVVKEFKVDKRELMSAISERSHAQTTNKEASIVSPIFEGVPMFITSKYIEIGPPSSEFIKRAGR